MPGPVAALILAAGFSTRMGAGYKPLLPIPYPRNTAVSPSRAAPAPEGNALEFLARLYAGAHPVVVVGGQRRGESVAAAAASLGLSHVRNPDAGRGMFSSICLGLESVAASGASHCFIHPVDIPLARPCTLHLLLEEARKYPEAVLIPTFQEEEGHPPLVPCGHIPAILAWPGERGLRGALEHLPRRFVPVPDGNILLDMDTDEDYALVRSRAGRQHLLEPEEARELLRCRRVEDRGVAHAVAVGRVAAGFALARKAAGLGTGIDARLAEAGGLLHDMCKGEKGHERAAGRELRAMGLPDMAALVEEHRDCSLPDGAPVTEKELVYLADKYVRGSGLVTLKDRFGQKMALFAGNPDALAGIAGRLARAEVMERRFHREAGIAPLETARRILGDTA